MIRSLNTAEKAMQMEQVRIDALANNLANVNSTGFRQIMTRVAESASQQPSDRDGGTDLQAQASRRTGGTPRGSWPQAGSMEMYHALDTRQGPVQATGRQTDIAIMSRGFFVVATDQGERYTRDGSMRLDENQQLTTSDGQLVQGEGGPIQLQGTEFSFENDGTIMVDGNAVGRLRLVDFEDATLLEHQGGNLLAAPPEQAAQPVPPEEVVVAQGHLEGSNVNAIETLVAMITAQRAFEVQSKVMSTEDEMLNKSVNNLPRAGS